MFLHDSTEIALHLLRSLTETIYEKTAVAIAVILAISWLYTRLYVFPLVIYESIKHNVY
jgi:site-specific recombinase